MPMSSIDGKQFPLTCVTCSTFTPFKCWDFSLRKCHLTWRQYFVTQIGKDIWSQSHKAVPGYAIPWKWHTVNSLKKRALTPFVTAI